jgi:hypothetical protein
MDLRTMALIPEEAISLPSLGHEAASVSSILREE